MNPIVVIRIKYGKLFWYLEVRRDGSTEFEKVGRFVELNQALEKLKEIQP